MNNKSYCLLTSYSVQGTLLRSLDKFHQPPESSFYQWDTNTWRGEITCPRSQKCKHLFNPCIHFHNLTKPQTCQKSSWWKSQKVSLREEETGCSRHLWAANVVIWVCLNGGWSIVAPAGRVTYLLITLYYVLFAMQRAPMCINLFDLSIRAKETETTELIQKDPKHYIRLFVSSSHCSTQKMGGEALTTRVCC